MTATLLGSKVKNAAHFTDGQEKTEAFKHVANVWQKQCFSFDVGMEMLAQDQRKIQDIKGPLSAWEPTVTNEDKLAIRHKPSGQNFVPTAKAVKDMAVIGLTSEWFLNDMLADKTKGKDEDEKVVFKRDRRDAEALAHVLSITLFAQDRIDQNKTRLFRTWSDGTLRAVLSEQYAIVNNLWFLETLAKLIPGGLLSHWRGDADTIFGNVLIPDTIREESDSHYGGMLSIGNSEIGLRRILSMPSVFRAICMNGCIWEQEKGEVVSQVHRGAIDFAGLEVAIAKNLQAQIPLLSGGIKKVLGSRLMKFGEVSTVQAVAQFFKDFKLPKSQSAKFLGHFNVEGGILGPDVRTAFGLQSALTRLGQQLDSDVWVKYDEIAGKLVGLTPDRWSGMMNRAKTLDSKEVESTLGDVSHLL
jgi:hypothetical protein